MVITGFDGRNISAAFDALELKAINEFLKRISPQQVEDVVAALKAAGFAHATSADCAVLAGSVNAIAGTLLNSVNLTAVEEENATDEEEAEAAPVPVQKKKTKVTIN